MLDLRLICSKQTVPGIFMSPTRRNSLHEVPSSLTAKPAMHHCFGRSSSLLFTRPPGC
jgi:hypothetical protein